MIYSNKHTPNTGPDLPVDEDIMINGEKLKEVDHAKYLGALIDNKLNWSYHINSVNLKLSKGLGLLAKIRHYVPSSIVRSLYFSFINPFIDYKKYQTTYSHWY